MAEKTKASRAESKVSAAKKKSSAGGSAPKSKSKASQPRQDTSKDKKQEYENPIPASFVTAVMSLALFVLFLAMAINPDGALLVFVKSVVLGLVGQAGFYFAIPGLLYLFVLNTFLRKKSAAMRSSISCAFCSSPLATGLR